jgi:hypothetical protein
MIIYFAFFLAYLPHFYLSPTYFNRNNFSVDFGDRIRAP